MGVQELDHQVRRHAKCANGPTAPSCNEQSLPALRSVRDRCYDALDCFTNSSDNVSRRFFRTLPFGA